METCQTGKEEKLEIQYHKGDTAISGTTGGNRVISQTAELGTDLY